MSIEAICDFDGTITDNSHAYGEYSEEFSLLLIKKFRFSVSEWVDAISLAKDEILANPKGYGWVDNGYIVAPATSEPLVFFTVIAQLALSKLGKNSTADELSTIHSKSLEKVELRFRKGAYDFVTNMNRFTSFTIVTNSKEVDTSKKVFLLLGENNVKVIGNAKKKQNKSFMGESSLFYPITKFSQRSLIKKRIIL